MTNRGGTIESLTPREREVLDLIARGKTNVEIASELGIRFDTAKWHVSEVLSKLGVERREEAARAWRESNRLHRRAMRAIGGTPTASWLAKSTAAAAGTIIVLVAVLVLIVLLLPDGGDDDALPGGVYVALTSVNSVTGPEGLRVFNARTGEVLLERDTPGEAYPSPRFSPDGSSLSTLFISRAQPSGHIVAFDLPAGTEHSSEPLDFLGVGAPVWSPDGERLAIAGQRLAVLNAEMETLGISDEVPDSGMPQSLPSPTWSPDSEHVATVISGALVLANRDGEMRIIPADVLGDDPPLGIEFDVTLDRLLLGRWLGTDRLEAIIDRDLVYPPVDPERAEDPWWQATGRIEGLDVRWEEVASISDADAAEALPFPSPQQIDSVRARAVAAVAGADDELIDMYMPFQTADGSAWVQVVPVGRIEGSSSRAEKAVAVILTDPPITVDLAIDPRLLSPRPGTWLDVVIAQPGN